MKSGEKWAIVVAGMHRSGTSVVARALSHLGADLPTRLMPPNQTNSEGHFEPEAIVALNDQILAEGGSSWSDWKKFSDPRLASPERQRLMEEIAGAITFDYGDSKLLLIKDPRICRILPLWKSILEKLQCRIFFVLPYRNPIEVANSLRQRNGIDNFTGYLLWLRHVLDAEFETRNETRIFFRYEDLLTDPVTTMARIASGSSIAWPGDLENSFREINEIAKPELRHNRADDDELNTAKNVPRWVHQTYQLYHTLAIDPFNKDSWNALDNIRASLDTASQAFSVLEGDDREDDLRRRRSNLQALSIRLREAQAGLASEPFCCGVSTADAPNDQASVGALTHALHEKSARISYFHAVLGQQVAALHEAQNLLASCTSKSEKLAEQLHARDAELKLMRDAAASRGWRATAPIRWLSRRLVRR